MKRLVLEGGAEFQAEMAAPDREAMRLAGGNNARICIIPAAAAPDNNHIRAGKNAESWFQQLGARRIAVLPLIDKASADDPKMADELRRAGLVYLLGGFPGYLASILSGSRSGQALMNAFENGPVVAGSSAGAMVLCQWYFDPAKKTVSKGLGLVPGVLLIPHHDTHGKAWAPKLDGELQNVLLVGVDEQTGMICNGTMDKWTVYGKGEVTVYQKFKQEQYHSGQCFRLSTGSIDSA